MRRIITPPAPSPSFDLIPISSDAIRALWIKRYQLLEKKLEKLKREWRLFEQDSVPHYQKWYHSTFWNELNQVNEWNEKAREQQKILMAIVAHQKIYRLNEIEAYDRVKERIDSKEDVFPDAEDVERYEAKIREREEAERKRREEARRKKQEEADQFWSSQQESQEYADAIQEAFERIFQSQDAETDGVTTHSREEVVYKRQDDLKTLYRSIVRELHPDTGHEMTPVEKEWWNQAQEAYRRSDIETLKLLALKIRGQGKVSLESVDSIGTLIDLCTALVEQQDEIDRQKRRLKKDPIYRFWTSRTRASNRDKLMFELRAQLHHDVRRLRAFVAEVKARLSDLEYFSERQDPESEDQEFRPRDRMRASLGKRGRGRGRGRGK